MKNMKGFTLIELLVTVAIVGILSSIAMPAYRTYIQRAQLTEAITAMSDMRVKLEQYFQDNRTYVGACANNTLAPLPTGLEYFNVSCDLDSDAYTVTATGQGFTFSVNESNERSTDSVPSGWTSSDSCWVINKNGQCS